MRVQMRHSLLALAALLASTGCVTESVYVGSDKPVVENKINNDVAARTRVSLALKYLAAGDSSQAKYNLERALKFSPELPEAHYSMAYYYQQVGENGLAKKFYESAIDIDPANPDTLNNYGVFLCSIGEFDAAADYMLQAIEIPSYLRVAESYENLALCAIENDEFDKAQDYLKASVQHSPLRGSSLINLAAISYAKSDLHRAQEFLKKYEKSGRISSRSLMLSYLIETRMGHIENANAKKLTIEQTYATSVEARQLKLKRLDNSEFERLREQYRKSELRKLKKEVTYSEPKAQPQIKIVKRKSANVENTQTSSVTEQNVQSVSTEVQSAPVKKEQAINSAAIKPVVKPQPMPQSQPEKFLKPQAKIGAPVVDATQFEAPFHIMQAGENLFSISVKYNVKLQKILDWNGLTEFDPVYTGTKIYLNNPNVYHIVKEGDTLFSISVKYNVLMKKLAQWNQLSEQAQLKPGTKLLLVNPKTYRL